MSRRLLRAMAAMALVGVAGAVGGLAALEVLGRLERAAVDARFAIRGDRPAPDEVVIVAFDNQTLRALDYRPPIPRGIHARVIDRLDRAGARVVAFDYSLEQPSDDPEADRRITLALMNARRAVVDVAAPAQDGSVADLAGFLPFRDIAVRPGDGGLPLDPEGAVRRFRRPPGDLDAFPIAAAKAYSGARRMRVPSRALIDYPGPAKTIEHLPYIDVLRGRFRRDAVRGRIAIVAPTATVLGDVHRVPVGGTMSGAEIHAAAMLTALADFPLREASTAGSRRLVALLGAAVPLLLFGAASVTRRIRTARAGGALLDTPGPLAAAAVASVTLVAWLAVAQLLFERGTVLPAVAGSAAILASGAAAVVLAVVLSRRERRRLREEFTATAAPVRQRVLASAGRSRAVTASDIIAGYTIEGRLGGGGMGVVWSARQERLDREVALKVISAEYAVDPEYRRRFVGEALRAAAISHPNVIPVIDAGEADGILFIAMVKVVGTDLKQTIRNAGALDADLALRLLDPVAQALDHAFDEHDGLLHRDVKPSNILIPDEHPAHPYLLDFGVSMTTAEAVRRARPEGTWPYLAPERWMGGEGRAADVYALTATLYECLTGREPFGRWGRRDLREAHASAPRPLVTDDRPDLPDALDGVVATGMALAPDQRYPTAQALIHAAAGALGTASLRAPSPSPADPMPRLRVPVTDGPMEPTEVV